MSVREFIKVTNYKDIKKGVASPCYPGMCGSMTSTIKWAHRYAKKDCDYASEVLDLAIKEQDRVRNVIKRFNRRFG